MQGKMMDTVLATRLDFRYGGNEKDAIGQYKRVVSVPAVQPADSVADVVLFHHRPI